MGISAHYKGRNRGKRKQLLKLLSAFSHEPRLYKRVCPSVGPSVRRSVRNNFVWTARDEPANDLFRVYELVHVIVTRFISMKKIFIVFSQSRKTSFLPRNL